VGEGIRHNHVSATHSQATLLAQSMMDRMASNVQGVWLGWYNGNHPAALGSSSACTGAPCSPADLADRDLLNWQAELAYLLPPGASATIACVALTPTPPLETNPAYNGSCLMTLAWAETDTVGAATVPTVSWRFRP
jgi:hypothetical protein